MAELNKTLLIDTLENGWGTYVARFNALSTQEQADFLARQGYATLADLLGHVTAWWERALRELHEMLADPQHRAEDVDVDTFNAAAVERFRAFDPAVTIQAYENMREMMVDLVKNLPETALEDEYIRDRLSIEVVGHLDEHIFPS
jgi:hypothetical protein